MKTVSAGYEFAHQDDSRAAGSLHDQGRRRSRTSRSSPSRRTGAVHGTGLLGKEGGLAAKGLTLNEYEGMMARWLKDSLVMTT
jgi:hypothetical protein